MEIKLVNESKNLILEAYVNNVTIEIETVNGKSGIAIPKEQFFVAVELLKLSK